MLVLYSSLIVLERSEAIPSALIKAPLAALLCSSIKVNIVSFVPNREEKDAGKLGSLTKEDKDLEASLMGLYAKVANSIVGFERAPNKPMAVPSMPKLFNKACKYFSASVSFGLTRSLSK